jgi:hypothetical protein
VEYTAPADTNPGREVWLLGGGDNAEVVMRRPSAKQHTAGS